MWPKVLWYILFPLHSHCLCVQHSGSTDPHFQIYLHLWYLCLFLSVLPCCCIFYTFFSFYSGICKSFNHHLLFLPLNSFLVYTVVIHPSFPVTLAFQDKLCLPHHILEGKGLTKVSFTVQALVDKASSRRDQRRSPCWRDVSWCCNTSDICSRSCCCINNHFVKPKLKDGRIQ